jgi:hypothetical protein
MSFARDKPWPCVLLLLAIALPPDLSAQVGSFRMSAYRFALIAFFLPSVYTVFLSGKQIASKTDFLIVLHALWVLIALIFYAGTAQGIESGGIYAIECLGSYAVARAYAKTDHDVSYIVRWVLVLVGVLLVFAIAESLTGNHFIRQASRTLLGGAPLPYIEPRLGLHRAFTSFDHPILFGIFCASMVGLTFYLFEDRSRPNRKYLATITLCAGTFFSLSSGAFAAAGAQCALIAYDQFTRGIKNRWGMIISALALSWITISLASSRSPIKVFLTYFTFSPGTGYNRLRIWEYGSAEVKRNPIFGIGLGEWERPEWMISSSMDNFWLATTVRYGLPAFVFLASAVLVQANAVANNSKANSAFAKGWLFSIIGLCLAGVTVHYWNALFCVFCFILGLGSARVREPRSNSAFITLDGPSHSTSPSETIALILRPIGSKAPL